MTVAASASFPASVWKTTEIFCRPSHVSSLDTTPASGGHSQYVEPAEEPQLIQEVVPSEY